jgi:hypothetical protein
MVEPMANDSSIDAEIARWLEDKPEIARLLEGKSEIARALKKSLPVVLEGIARAKERVANSNEPSTDDAPNSPDFPRVSAACLCNVLRDTADQILGWVEKPNKTRLLWWAHKGSNLGPLPCEG